MALAALHRAMVVMVFTGRFGFGGYSQQQKDSTKMTTARNFINTAHYRKLLMY